MKKYLTMAVILLAGLGAAIPASAKTIYLQCGGAWHEKPIPIDFSAHTAQGKPAKITPASIDWDDANSMGDEHVHIDRTTGMLSTSGVYYTPNGNKPLPHDDPVECKRIKPPKTKF